MSNETFKSAGQTYNMTINPAIPTTNGKKYPVIFLIHGNAGLIAPFGDQIHGFAKDLAALGYLTVVPEYYADNKSHLSDFTPHTQTLADAIEAIKSTRTDADLDRLGLIGFSLGATTVMTYVVSVPAGTVKVLADFFGFLTPSIKDNVANFPPTIILHNKHDQVVDFSYSDTLDELLTQANIKHEFDVYDALWLLNHSFKPGDPDDVDSRAKTTNWFSNHL
jgi:dienelactone hydrolase